MDGGGVSGHACGTQQSVLSGGRVREELTCEKVNGKSRIAGVGQKGVARERGDHRNSYRSLRSEKKSRYIGAEARQFHR